MSFVCLWSPAWRTVAVVPPGQAHRSREISAAGVASAPLTASPAGPSAIPPAIPPAGQRPTQAARPEIAAALLARAPRVAIGKTGERGVIWADAHGFSVHGTAALAAELVALLERRGVADVRAGVADTPVAAELAAVFGGGKPGGRSQLVVVPPGTDRAYVALFPLTALDPDPRLRPLLFGIGVTTCGELAALDRESIEVRLGAAAVPLWRLARADDPRLIFSPSPPDAPHASLDWVEYALKDPMRLLFVLNSLIERVCTTLAATGEGARELTIEFALTSRQVHVEVIRASRATANRRTWVRITRARVERITLSAAVTGITVHASRIAEREAPQGDLFDRGLASSQATEDAVARLIEDQGEVVVAPENSAHPLLDERTTWVPRKPADAIATVPATPAADRHTIRLTTIPTAVRERLNPVTRPQLLLQLAPAPLAISVETTPRRDHFVPVRYRDATGWHEIVNVAGPEHVSGRHWDGDATYAREYFRCVTREGLLVWLFRDANEGRQRPPARAREGAVRKSAVQKSAVQKSAVQKSAVQKSAVQKSAVRTRDTSTPTSQWFLHGWWD